MSQSRLQFPDVGERKALLVVLLLRGGRLLREAGVDPHLFQLVQEVEREVEAGRTGIVRLGCWRWERGAERTGCYWCVEGQERTGLLGEAGRGERSARVAVVVADPIAVAAGAGTCRRTAPPA
jgi:hypothetical protein